MSARSVATPAESPSFAEKERFKYPKVVAFGMADPTSNIGEVDEEDAPRCEVCDEPIVENPDHRVVPRIEDGQAVHYHFCGEECVAEWRE